MQSDHQKKQRRTVRALFMAWMVLVGAGIWQGESLKSAIEAPFEQAASSRHMAAEGRKLATAQMISRVLHSFKKTTMRRTPATWFADHWELSRNVLLEAGIEQFRGKLAVACITLNRVRSKAYPATVKGVVWQTAQFSWTHLSKYAPYRGPKAREAIRKVGTRYPSWRKAWADSQRAAAQVLSGAYKCGRFAGIYHYMNPDHVSQRHQQQWRRGYRPAFRIGRHVFWKRIKAQVRHAHNSR
jgi:spore germination cell wall hydrolase CwlJ-like protein